jgi:hypothetical protein
MHFALLGVLAVAPSVVLFQDAHREVLGRFKRSDWLAFDDARRQRDAGLGEVAGCLQPEERRRDRSDLYPPPRPGGTKPGSPVVSPPGQQIAGWVVDRLPAFSHLAARLRVLDSVPEAAPVSPSPGRVGVAGMLGLAVASTLVFALLWWVVRRLFLLDADPSGVTNMPAPDCQGVWVLAHPRTSPPAPSSPAAGDTCFDLRRGESLSDMSDALRGARPLRGVVRIDHLEHRLDEPAWEERVVELLEARAEHPDQPVLVTSEIHPVHLLSSQLRDERPANGTAPSALNGDPIPDRLARWTRVLQSFEVRWHDQKQVDATDGQSEDAVDDRLQARHWGLWSRCSHAEKLALRQLAEEGFLSPESVDVVRDLMRRGLIRRTPALALETPSFRRFVLRAEAREAVAAWEGEVGPSGWAMLRIPLTAGVAFGVLVLVVTQPELLQTGASAVTALAAAIPLLLRLLGLVGRESAPTAGK